MSSGRRVGVERPAHAPCRVACVWPAAAGASGAPGPSTCAFGDRPVARPVPSLSGRAGGSARSGPRGAPDPPPDRRGRVRPFRRARDRTDTRAGCRQEFYTRTGSRGVRIAMAKENSFHGASHREFVSQEVVSRETPTRRRSPRAAVGKHGQYHRAPAAPAAAIGRGRLRDRACRAGPGTRRARLGGGRTLPGSVDERADHHSALGRTRHRFRILEIPPGGRAATNAVVPVALPRRTATTFTASPTSRLYTARTANARAGGRAASGPRGP